MKTSLRTLTLYNLRDPVTRAWMRLAARKSRYFYHADHFELMSVQFSQFRLSHLDLSESRIGNQAVFVLFGFLTRHRFEVEIVKLYKNCIGDEGMAVIASWLERGSRGLEELHLSGRRAACADVRGGVNC